ncbi:beta-phosphoglucomutase [Rivularia sp. UHCC 0363]|uniref:beta-phosphoglucomutase n=1 Tax=Rivularia sp. UHCC 0363 TaxID=3110244 RepID=UPI002B209BC8|nr:beta-phosphoglucomutase [Rivularia sp. UHCC 0363]MEA5598844.1 beta-phosphoglucomutase [Rivularia sp. UHCC 0363]
MNQITLDPHLLYEDWILTENYFDPDQLNYKETVFTIGNGYLGTRGSFAEGYPGAEAATLINGVYDDVPIYYTELVNCPDWLPLYIIIDDEEFRLDKGEIFSYQRQLDLKRGILSRKISWCSPNGKTIDLYFECFASQADQNVLGLRIQLTPIDFDGKIRIRGSIDGNPEDKDGFNPWLILDQGYGAASSWLHVRTRTSRIQLGMAFKLSVSGTKATFRDISVPGFPTVEAKVDAVRGATFTIEKLVTVFTSREVENPALVACDKLQELPTYEDLRKNHEQAWQAIWHHSDIVIEGSAQAQLVLRYNLFQLLISAPRHDDRVSIPAKTLSGFGYRGHIFWDTEFFILPFFIFTQPDIARNLLTYRYHTLEGARRKAKYYGYRGAMYAWESAATGDEVTPRWAPAKHLYEEDIRIWCRDREIHISADISIAVWLYWQVTNDHEWMRDYGAEIILDTALFWSSRVHLDVKRECYSIVDVIGPDEYHENIDNNAFTNRMVQWHLQKALNVYDWLSKTFPEKAEELEQKLQVTPKRRIRWQDIAENLVIPYDSQTGLIEQFEGFFELKDLNLADYEPRTDSMLSILGIKEVNKRQVIKQPDVLMLLYLMERTAETDYGKEVLQKNWDYYAPRTDITYGSSLGPAIHGLVAASLGKTGEAYENFRLAALVDLENTRGNAAEGIHAASCGSIWQAVIFGVAGIQFTKDGPVAKPHLPPTWKRLQFKLHWRGEWQDFDLKPEIKTLKSEIKGIIFDLDGVLTDTAELHYQAWQKLADEEDIPFDREANEALRGISRRDSLIKIIGDRNYSESQIQEMMERKNSYYVESIQQITPQNLLPGAGNLIDELRSKGIKIAIGSASKNARNVIERLGIADQLDAIADGNSVNRSKPAPDLFLYAASQLELEPTDCIVVEDAASGVEAALAGGMRTIGIGSIERVGAAHIILPNLEGVTLKDIQHKLSFCLGT